MNPDEQLQKAKEDAARRLALLVEVRVALLAAGWAEDDLLKRLRAEIAPQDKREEPK